MSFINVEIKARTNDPESIRQFLLLKGAQFKGIDHQTDTYFNTPHGRLKLREGNIENNLIFYDRGDLAGPKQSNFSISPVQNSEELKGILSQALGVKIIVKKEREIYYIDNVKFHIDSLNGIGHFIEIEAGNKTKDLPLEQLQEQCSYYMQAFGIAENELVSNSYSDLLIEKTTTSI